MAKKDRIPENDQAHTQEMFEEVMRALKKMSKSERLALFEGIRQDIAESDLMKITESDWVFTHPNSLKCGSDRFYAQLATKLQKAFLSVNLPLNLPKGFFSTTVLGITAYLEDLKSDFGIWQAVRSSYASRYGRLIPFYDTTDDYYEDDINQEDLKIIIWQAFNRCGAPDGRSFSPYSPAVDRLSEIAFDTLVEAFDDAPATTRVSDYIHRVFKRGDYYELRSLALWLSAFCPLTAVPFMDEHIDCLACDIMDFYRERLSNEISTTAAFYMAECDVAWLEYMGLTGYSTAQLLSRIARQHGYEKVADILLTVKSEPTTFYTGESVNEDNTVTFRNEMGETFRVSKDSLNKNAILDDFKSAYLSIVRFGDVYYINGHSALSPDVLQVPDEIFAGKPVPELLQFIDDVVARHNGRRIFYCRSTQEVSALLDNKIKPALMDEDCVEDEPKNFLLMLSSTLGPMLATDFCQVFKDKDNPFYTRYGGDAKGRLAWTFICNYHLPDDIIDYIVGNNLLPSAFMEASQGRRFGKEIVQRNMDFLLHFNRVSTYAPDEYDEGEEDEEYDD